jgi:hypothetical protein
MNPVSNLEATATSTRALASFRITINGHDLALADPLPIGRQILTEAGFNPPDEHVLIELLPRRTRSIGLNEEIDLRTPGRESFRAFRSDRMFLFTVDGNGYEWGASPITEAELRAIADVASDSVLVLERENDTDLVLTPYDRVVFDETIEKHIPRGNHMTEELLALLGVTPGYQLNVLDTNGQLQPLHPGQTVYVKEGMKFYSQAPGGGAS